MGPRGDHVFISYAWDDMPLADWLEAKLTVAGYRVWRDKNKMPGGESVSSDVDHAIRDLSHRLVAILSPTSLSKPNPIKERTLALHLSREWQIPFMIPLNLGVRPAELTWNISDLAYIDFQSNWNDGLATLLKALAKAGTPQPLADGADAVTASLVPADLALMRDDPIISNLFPVTHFPEAILEFRTGHRASGHRWDNVRRTWPAYRVDDHRVLAFEEPKDADWRRACHATDACPLHNRDEIRGISTRNILKHLVEQSLRAASFARGMVTLPGGAWLHIPWTIGAGRRYSFRGLGGRKTSIGLVGERSYFVAGKGGEKYRYYLHPRFRARDDVADSMVVQLTVSVHVSDPQGNVLPRRTAHSRRKHATHDWWNQEWGNRYLAVMDFIAEGKNEIVIGPRHGQQMRISSRPIRFSVRPALNDVLIERRREDRRKLRHESGE